jgi:GT2 family glycosyltransferase
MSCDPASSDATPEVSVIVPARNAARDLRKCLERLQASQNCRFEIIVIDDASTDETPHVALEFGVRLLQTEQRKGPAIARNRGATAARGEILVFIDADVLVYPDTLQRLIRTLHEADCAAVFGSYDTQPSATNLVSQYKNLVHHHVHQHARREATTFWSGCGAIRRAVFAELGGFAESYSRPCIEDIELGLRLRRPGYRIVLDKQIQVTHTKRWTVWSLIRTDVFDRGIPWTRLILQQRDMPNDLNLKMSQRISAVLVFMMLILLLILARREPSLLILALSIVLTVVGVDYFSISRRISLLASSAVSLALLGWFMTKMPMETGFVLLPVLGVVGLNRSLFAFLARHRGLAFATIVLPLHMFYYCYSGAALGVGLLEHGYEKLRRVAEAWQPAFIRKRVLQAARRRRSFSPYL